MFCPQCGREIEDQEQKICTNCGARIEPYQEIQRNPYQQPDFYRQEIPMNWYKIIIYVLLFVVTLVNIIRAILCFSGSYLPGASLQPPYVSLLLFSYPALRFFTYGCGLLCVAVAVLAIIVRQWLAHFKKKGVKGLVVLYICMAAFNLLCPVILFVIAQITLNFAEGASAPALIAFFAPSVIMCAGKMVLLAVTIPYFRKRAALFH